MTMKVVHRSTEYLIIIKNSQTLSGMSASDEAAGRVSGIAQ